MLIIVVFILFVKEIRGFEYLKRIGNDYYLINQLPKIPDYEDKIINIPYYLHDLTNEQLLDIITKNDTQFFSQRLIMGLNNYYSFDYILYKLFNKSMNIDMNATGIYLLKELSKKFKYGLGGVHLSYNLMVSIKDLNHLNNFIDQLNAMLTIERKYNFLDSQITMLIMPQFYCDYNFLDKGIMNRVINNFENSETKNLDSNIYYMNIDGLFGPNLDYNININKMESDIIDKCRSLEAMGIQSFAKHFGYRKDFRYSKNNKYANTHTSVVYQKTPFEIFIRDDMVLYDNFINQTKISGIMIGHQILEMFDKNIIASASSKVKTFINQRYKRNLITISDSINMYAFKNSYNVEISIYDYVKTDYILLTDIYNYSLDSILKKGDQESQDSVNKILKQKYLNGKIIIKKKGA